MATPAGIMSPLTARLGTTDMEITSIRRQCLALGDMPDGLFVIAGMSAESWPDFSLSTGIGLTCWCSGWRAGGLRGGGAGCSA